MGMNLKEKLQNLNKKKYCNYCFSIICSGYLLSMRLRILSNENFQASVTAPTEGEPDLGEVQEATQQQEEQAAMKPSEYKIGMDYEKAMTAKKPVIVLFYADWCHYCIKFMPTYLKLSETYKNEYNFSKVNVEDSKYEKLVREIGITGFPTVFIIDPKYDNRVLLSNAIFGDMDKLQAELDRFARIRKLLDTKK